MAFIGGEFLSLGDGEVLRRRFKRGVEAPAASEKRGQQNGSVVVRHAVKAICDALPGQACDLRR